MSSILDQLIEPNQFIPTTTEEFLALQLAKRLDDEEAIGKYLHYVAHHPASHLLQQFHRAKRSANPAFSFHLYLKQAKS
jgi:hypothetical protein